MLYLRLDSFKVSIAVVVDVSAFQKKKSAFNLEVRGQRASKEFEETVLVFCCRSVHSN